MAQQTPPKPHDDAERTVLSGTQPGLRTRLITDTFSGTRQGPPTALISETSIAHSLPGRPAIATDSSGDLQPAKQVGRYQIVEKLGEGAMATVYRAYDPGIDRPLVLKFLRPEMCVDGEVRTRFLREAKAAGMLSHPNIVTVFDVGEIEGRPYIAMELLDGGPLGDLLKAGKPVAVRDAIDIGVQLAHALDYAHSKGIYHRDIKPNNIIRLRDSRVVKVADFGIAHIAAKEATEATRVGTVIGTPHYMSPEQAIGEKSDARSDLWAVGVILYELLTGQRPFDAESMVTLVYRIAKEEPKPIAEIRKDAPAGLRRIVARCLQKQPDKRFSSGAELGAALAKLQKELEAEEVDNSGQPRRIPLKVRLALGMAGIVAATMALTASYVNHRQYQAMLQQTVDQGASLAKLIAVESAVPALSEDWTAIDVFTQEVARSLQVAGLTVVDRDGTVRVSTDAASVDKKVAAIEGEALPARDPNVRVRRVSTAKGTAFAFETPITFQGKRVGDVRLMEFEEPLAAVARQSWGLMALLLLVTAATVLLTTYLLVERYSKLIRLLRESLEELGRGRFGYRIGESRNDEIGDLYRAFDQMAARIEQSAPAIARASPPTLSEPPEALAGTGTRVIHAKDDR
jgi:serine/threonine protein kinase